MGIKDTGIKMMDDQRKHNKGQKLPIKLSERIVVMITRETLKSIKKLIKKGEFPNKSEFVRYTIRKYLDGDDSWSEAFKRIYNNKEVVNERIGAMLKLWEEEDNGL